MAASVNALLVGCLLYLCYSLGDASVETVSSVASSVVERSLPLRLRTSVFGHGKQLARLKRSVDQKTLEDPKACLSQCRDNQTQQIMRATRRNIGRLVALSLSNIEGDEVSTPEKEAEFKKKIEDTTIANMGPFFEDLCTVTTSATKCYSQCPESKTRSVMVADNQGTEAAFCEPGKGKNWGNFSEYWDALNCTNSTETDKPCENKCGPDQAVHNVTKLEIQDEEVEKFLDDAESSSTSDGIVVKYESDSKKNTAAVGPVCKSTVCQIDCYKPLITKKCGAKAYDMYSRMSKVEPRASLTILKLLNAVEDTSDCKAFQ